MNHLIKITSCLLTVILSRKIPKKRKKKTETLTHTTHTHNNFSSSLLHAKQPEEQTVARVRVEEGCKHEALHRHQLHDDVQRRSGGVLERIADGVSRHRRLVRLRSLGSERRRVVARASLDVLLRVVPRSSGVGHGDGELHARHERADEHASERLRAEQHAAHDRASHDEHARGHHLGKRSLRGDFDAALVVRRSGALHQPGDGAELLSHLLHHRQGSLADGLHRHGGEPVREHRADEHAAEHARRQNRRILVEHVRALHVRAEERERHESRRSDGEALANRRGGVAGGVERVRSLANVVAHVRHLGNAAGVVRDGPVRVDGKAGGENAEHAECGARDAVHRREAVAYVDGNGNGEDGDDGALVSQREAEDDVGGGARLARVGNILHGLVAVGRVVLGDEADEQSSPEPGDDAVEDVVVLRDFRGIVGEQPGELSREQRGGEEVHAGRHQHGGEHQLELQGRLNLADLRRGLNVGGDERGDERDEDANGGDAQREHHRGPHVLLAEGGEGGNHERGARAFGEASEEVGTHAGNVADVVADVVRDGCGVARVILGDVLLHLADEVGTHVGSLGVDSAAHTPEQRDGRAAEAVSRNRLEQSRPVLLVVRSEAEDGDVENEEAAGGENESHDGS
mmetsp:Transcript_15694/g.39782  ORF Transcript_15694/g.39782 Transcript_15694/m.39782 type:complete len:631 (-) Transcript_15694:526-2418(-)